MSSHAHIHCDLAAMAITTYDAHIAPEQESALVELWKFGESADNNSFAREFGLPDLDQEFWEICEPSGEAEEDDLCCED